MVLDAGGPAWNLENNTIVFFSGVEGGLGQLWTIAKDGKKRDAADIPSQAAGQHPVPLHEQRRSPVVSGWQKSYVQHALHDHGPGAPPRTPTVHTRYQA